MKNYTLIIAFYCRFVNTFCSIIYFLVQKIETDGKNLSAHRVLPFSKKGGWHICTSGCVNKGYLTHRRRQQELHSRQIAENSKQKQQHHTDISQNPFKPAIFLQPFRMPDNTDEKQRPPEKDQPCHSNVFLYSAGNVKMQQSYKKMGDAASGAGKLCDSLEQTEEMKWSELD